VQRTLLFQLSYQCNIRCAHCCYSCGPSVSDMHEFLAKLSLAPGTPSTIPALSNNDVISALEQAAELGIFSHVSFTGGETTLNRRLLLEALPRAKALGLHTRIVTNGSFARTPTSASRLLTELRSAGLDFLYVSCGDYHREFVPIDSLRNCLTECLSLGLQMAFGAVIRQGSEVCREFLIRELPIPEELLGKSVEVFEYNVVKTGRAEHLPESDFETQAEPSSAGRCLNVTNQVVITPDKKVLACCGFPHREIPELQLGDALVDTFPELLARMQSNYVIQWLHAAGPAGIAARVSPGEPWNHKSICEGCRAMLVAPEMRTRIQEYLDSATPEELVANLVPLDSETRGVTSAVLPTLARLALA
jgi:hypothetical protein